MPMKSIPSHTPLLYSKTGVYRYLIFLFLFQNIDCGYWLEPPQCVVKFMLLQHLVQSSCESLVPLMHEYVALVFKPFIE